MWRPGDLDIDPISGGAPVRVLYILGCGRSGSTILDTILGNHAAVESVGEAGHAVQAAWRDDGLCACGRRGSRCDYWCKVRRRWTERAGPVDIERYLRTMGEMEARPTWSSNLPGRAPRTGLPPSEYLRLTGELLAAIRDTSGKTWVVDSSKRALRARTLAMIPGIDLRVIHLVRDCRGVAWSRKKRFKKDEQAGVTRNDRGKTVWRAALIWNVSNVQSGWLRRQLPEAHSIRVRYEDFVSDPVAEMARIGALIDVDFRELAELVAAEGELSIGHTIAGNRMRMSGRVRLRPDTEWMGKLSAWDRCTCWAISGWLLRSYGYRLVPAESARPSTRRAA